MSTNDRRHIKSGKSDGGCCSSGSLMTIFALIMVVMIALILCIVGLILNPMARKRNPSSGNTRLKKATEILSNGLVDSRAIHKTNIDEKIDMARMHQSRLPPKEESICDSLDEKMPLLLSILRGEEVKVYYHDDDDDDDDAQQGEGANFRKQSLIEEDMNGFQIPFASDMRVSWPVNDDAAETVTDSSSKIVTIKGFNRDLIDRAFRKKHLYFIGDSTSRNLFVALRRLLNYIQFGAGEDKNNETARIRSDTLADKFDGLDYDRWTHTLAILFAKAQKKWKLGASLPPYMIPADRTYLGILDVNSLYSESPKQLKSTEEPNLRGGFINLANTTLVNPQAIIFNAGLHLLQLIPNRKLNHYQYEAWTQYESTLETLLQVSMDSNAPIILAKSTNRICNPKFGPDYRKYAKLYTENDPKTLEECATVLKHQEKDKKKEAQQKGHNITGLSQSQREEICKFGTMNDEGSSLLNQRMATFVQQKRSRMADRLRYFNDHDIEGCNFTRGGDGRHYTPQVFVRLHLLAIMLDCMSG